MTNEVFWSNHSDNTEVSVASFSESGDITRLITWDGQSVLLFDGVMYDIADPELSGFYPSDLFRRHNIGVMAEDKIIAVEYTQTGGGGGGGGEEEEEGGGGAVTTATVRVIDANTKEITKQFTITDGSIDEADNGPRMARTDTLGTKLALYLEQDNAIAVLDLATEAVLTIPVNGDIMALVMSPDGTEVISYSFTMSKEDEESPSNHTPLVYSTTTGALLRRTNTETPFNPLIYGNDGLLYGFNANSGAGEVADATTLAIADLSGAGQPEENDTMLMAIPIPYKSERLVLTANYSGTTTYHWAVYDAAFEFVSTIEQGPTLSYLPRTVMDTAIDPYGTLVAVYGENDSWPPYTVTVIDTADWSVVSTTLTLISPSVIGLRNNDVIKFFY